MRRRVLLTAAAPLALAACGFQLRRAPEFSFRTLYLAAPAASPVAGELRKMLIADGAVQVVPAPEQAQAILDILAETREKVVVGLSTAGQVREFQLRSRVRFRLRTPGGKELIPESELLLQRDVSFNESLVLAKESEENLLYRDMQGDIVQQLMRRLAAVKAL